MSTKMELTKEVEKLLNKARTLKLRNEAYFQQSKSQTSSCNVSSQLHLDADINLEDGEDVNQDIIDVNAIDLQDDETWLCKLDTPSKHEDVFRWIRNDIEEVKDSRYHGQQIILQYELTRLTNKLDNNIDSRTFTRPKKKMTRPSLESINSSFKYSAYKNDDFTETPNVCNRDTSDLRLSLLKNTDTYRKKSTTNDSVFLQDFYKSTKDDTIANIQRISNKIKEVENNSSFKNISNNLDLSGSLENIIRGQMQKLEVKQKPNFHVDELVQNSSPTPSLMSNSGFHSSNFTSLTESDFITAECQPQDLFTSYTSTVATDLTEDQGDVILGMDETYAKDIHNLCETISKDINSKIQDTTFVAAPDDLDDTHSIEDVSINNITYIESPSYIEKRENLGSGDNKDENNYETHEVNNLNISHKQNATQHITEKQSTKILNETNVISYSESEKEFIETDTEKSYCDGSGDNTFTKLSASNKISLSDPNLLEQKCMNDDSLINRTFEKSKMQNIRNESSDSLDLNSSFSSINSSRIVDFDNKTVVNGPNKFLLQRRLESTPKLNSKLVKQSWASIETLSPVLHSSPKREARPVRSAQSIDNTTRITRNALSETKVINCELSEEAQRTFRRIDKTHSVYKTTEDVSSLKEMQQIPTPMEVKRLAAPSTTSTGDLKVNSTITVQPQIKPTMLRQPATRSGLPRPTSTASIVSGIPRPQSRLPVPRSIKPPSASLTKPVIPTKNNWMDGCY
ncbi:homeobox protein 13-like isoform X2 [Chrysoperla carnea]|uniref:homeobox protein 13-like isoform X2 n=1 Tax=Chrysoperla carnea TaxID=189513 RepID=UPI001D0941DB|nr:homeobox protein 13-like isoform X2 [Chrysoperla carnea]